MRRGLLTFLFVTAISGWISQGEQAVGLASPTGDWVHTAAGWELRTALERTPRRAPVDIHPSLVAAFQLGASLFFLIAFPARVSAQPLTLAARPQLRPHAAGRLSAAVG